MKLILIHILNKYEIYACDKTPLKLELDPKFLLNQPKEKVLIKISERQGSTELK